MQREVATDLLTIIRRRTLGLQTAVDWGRETEGKRETEEKWRVGATGQ